MSGVGRTTDVAELLVAIVVPIWALDYTVTKIALRGLDPLAFATLRFTAASAILLVIWAVRPPPAYSRSDWLRIVISGIAGVAIYQFGFTTGLKSITASASALLITSSPIFTILIAALLEKRTLVPLQIGGSALAFLGVALLVREGLQGTTLSWANLGGYLLTLLSAVSFGVRSVVLQPSLERYPAVPTVTMSIVVGTLVLSLISAGQLAHQDWSAVGTTGWLCVAYAAIFSSVIGYVFWFYGIGKIGATRTMLYYYFVPLMAVAVAALVLGEQVNPWHAGGGIAIVGGVVLARSHDSPPHIRFPKAGRKQHERS